MNKEKVVHYLKEAFLSFVWLFVLLFAIDICSKWAVEHNLDPGDPVQIIPGFLSVELSHNKGMAWSFLEGDTGRIFLAVISGIASVAIPAYFIFKYKTLNKFMKATIMVIFAGAFGNFIDRAFVFAYPDGVIDWIKFSFGSYDFPTFNIADSCLVVGIIMLIVYMIVLEIKEYIKKNKNAELVGEKSSEPILSKDEIERIEYQKEKEAKDKEKQDENLSD